eukprot:Seg1063.6 transcript_id=Seg1063.6/GoldUCD/mRNA.D3Y31 product="hypothetical protein" protein_id=Seg1063.6/GoldUCD/D3Y31
MDEPFETDVDDIHHCYYSIDQADISQDDVSIDEAEDKRRWGIEETIHQEHDPSNRQSLAASVIRCAWICFQNTVVCGTIVGIIATTVWWLDLNLGMCCYGYNKQRDKMPVKYQRTRLTSEIFEGMIIQLWPFSILCGAFDWSTLTRLNLPMWNIIAAYTDAVCRLFVYVYGRYNTRLKSYIGNVIFFALAVLNYIKIGCNHRSTISRRYGVLSLALKLSLQFLFGIAICLPFNYWFLAEFKKSDPLLKAVLASVIPVMFAIPKLLTTFVHARLEGVSSPGQAVMFTIGFQVSAVLACRLLQANNENFKLFILISFVHGILNVIDKLLQPVRDRLGGCICPSKRNTRRGRSARASRLIADQALVNMMTETSGIIMSSASCYIITYYYIRDPATGSRVDGYTLLHAMVKRVGLAILIEYVFTTIALLIQTHKHNIPVIKVWVLKWKWIFCMHSVQVIFAMLYFPGHIDDVSLHYQLSRGNYTIGCLGPFERF